LLSFLIIFSSTGIANEPVLPLPVSAWAKISLLSRISGMVCAWTSVGVLNPSACKLSIKLGLNLSSSNVIEVVMVVSLGIIIKGT
jgi:hypothetical protein